MVDLVELVAILRDWDEVARRKAAGIPAPAAPTTQLSFVRVRGGKRTEVKGPLPVKPHRTVYQGLPVDRRTR